MKVAVALVGAVAVFAAGVAVGSAGPTSAPGGRAGEGSVVDLRDRLELAGALTSFPACDDYLAHVREHALEQVTPYGIGGGGGWYAADGEMRAVEESAAGGDDAVFDDLGAPSAGTTPEGVSGTNVQEQGVDEPDRVKTDGDTLYVVAGDRLRIVDIRGDQPVELAEVPLREGGWGAELLLAGDRLLVTSAQGGFAPFAGERISGDAMPSFGSTTTLTAVDVRDPSSPEVVERLIVDGATLTARMVDGVARIVVRTEPGINLPWAHPEAGGLRSEREALATNERLIEDSLATDWLPYYVHETADGDRDEGTLVACERVAAPAGFAGLGLVSVLTVDVAAGELTPDRGSVAVLTGGDTIYASRERLYVATQRWNQDVWPRGGGGWSSGAAPVDDVAIERRFPVPDDDPDVTTEVHAFATDAPRSTAYLGSGAVDGTLLSQWAMSEHEGVLRVASTIGDPWSAVSSQSAVTTLELRDGSLVELGRVDGLGPTETIRAVRFLGDVGYVVTFRQTDPLYTVDLSDPVTPKVVGELKIPGYSGYLHPVGDHRLIGVGQDADEEGVTLGVQVSLFDVSDPADPRRTDTVTVPRSESPVEWDHRSFLHWPATGLTVIPVTRYFWGEPGEAKPTGPTAGALTLVPDGDVLRAAAGHTPDQLVLSHADGPPAGATDDQVARAFDDGYANAITRSLVAGDRLLTISDRGLLVSDLTTLRDRGALGF
ncbi:MAG: beta-propeller domain-containing protein [Nitriliruptor sp.]|uniref:beta-propeller domain-containing protein n=1 Tax=Nitriliruptor sp. TaxID=2448056 RepID=UPI0034A063C6